MKVTKSKIEGVCVIEPDIYRDERGFLMESFQINRYKELAGIDCNFVVDIFSRSSKNVLRGLHFQKKFPQGKLVRASKGEILDVAVDIRKESSTFGLWESFLLTEENRKQVWVPPGLAHGFLIVSDQADFEYKASEFYHPEDEFTLLWNDPHLGIEWSCKNPILSEKDKKGIFFKDI